MTMEHPPFEDVFPIKKSCDSWFSNKVICSFSGRVIFQVAMCFFVAWLSLAAYALFGSWILGTCFDVQDKLRTLDVRGVSCFLPRKKTAFWNAKKRQAAWMVTKICCGWLALQWNLCWCLHCLKLLKINGWQMSCSFEMADVQEACAIFGPLYGKKTSHQRQGDFNENRRVQHKTESSW